MKCTIEREVAEISKTGSSAKRLTVASWNDGPAKLDLRTWLTDEDPPRPCKGITLTNDEAAVLCKALQAYLSEQESPEDPAR